MCGFPRTNMPSTSIHAENGLPVSCCGLEMLVGTLLLTLVLAGGAGCFWLAAPKVGPLTRTAGQLSPIEWKRALVKSMSTGISSGHPVVHFSCPFSIQCAIAVTQGFLFGCLRVARGFGCTCMQELIYKGVVFQLMGCCLGASGWHVVLVRLLWANELQKACFEADLLLFGCLWVACAN